MRRFLVLLVLLALLVGIALWIRPARRPRAGSEPGVAAVPALAPSSRPVGGRAGVTFAWLAQRGVAGRRIAGRVLHAGQPVANAVVRLTTEELHVGEWPIAQVETDDAGRFDLGLRPASQYRVVAQAEGLVAAGARVDLRAPDPRPVPDALTIELRDCDLVVRGTVRDAAGGVIIGAHLRAGTYSSEFGTTSSDEEGHYRLCVSAGPVHIEAGADGYGTALKHTRGRREVSLDFALVPEIVIAGRVVDAEGAPVGGAVVVAATDGHEPGVVAESAADGRFRLEGLVAGAYLVIARADDRAAEKSLNVAAGGATADLVLTLEPRAPLAGRVMVGGQPAGGAKVIISSVDGPWKLGSAVSQTDGRFSIAGLSRGAVRVSVDGHKLVSPDATLDLAVVHDIELICERLATVSGRVVREGKPVGRAEVQLNQEARRVHSTSGHDDGTFEIEGVAAGSYKIYAQSIAKGAFMALRPLEVGARDVAGLVLELDLAASIAGVVVDAKGAPVAGAEVRFVRDEDQGSDITAADGTFLVTALAGGGDYRAQVNASAEDYVRYRPPPGQRFPVVHVADETSHVTGVRIAILRGNLTITGRVVRGGEPVAGVDILASSGAGMTRAQSGADGSFVLGGLVPGRYRLFVERRGGFGGTPVETEAGAKDVRIELPPAGAIEGTLRGFRAAPEVTVVGVPGGVVQQADVTDTKFSIADIPVGTYEVHAVAANGGYGSARVSVTTEGIARVTIDAGATAQVTGVVTDWRTGAPIVGAQCGWYRESAGTNRPVQVDAAGGFAFRVPTGRVQIQCYAGYATPAREVVVDLAPDGSARVAVELIVARRRNRSGGFGVGIEGHAPDPLRITGLGGAAAASGLRIGDIVVRVDGRSVAGLSPDAVYFLISDHDAGSPAKITVERDGAELSFDVAPEAPPREPD